MSSYVSVSYVNPTRADFGYRFRRFISTKISCVLEKTALLLCLFLFIEHEVLKKAVMNHEECLFYLVKKKERKMRFA